jgi:hypothetical protein
VGDPAGQGLGLARAGPGHDEQRASHVSDGVELTLVEVVQIG